MSHAHARNPPGRIYSQMGDASVGRERVSMLKGMPHAKQIIQPHETVRPKMDVSEKSDVGENGGRTSLIKTGTRVPALIKLDIPHSAYHINWRGSIGTAMYGI